MGRKRPFHGGDGHNLKKDLLKQEYKYLYMYKYFTLANLQNRCIDPVQGFEISGGIW
jgi:hypothetical protein